MIAKSWGVTSRGRRARRLVRVIRVVRVQIAARCVHDHIRPRRLGDRADVVGSVRAATPNMTSTLRGTHIAVLVAFASGCVSELHPTAPRTEAIVDASESDPATPLGDDGTAPRRVRADLWKTEHRVPTAAIVGTSVFVVLVVAGIVAGAVALSQHGPATSGGGGGHGGCLACSPWGGWGGGGGNFGW